ncbi:hypothetical protein G7072_03915 [Nocardioides sp. HDW12B]|uniref:hypothetical protein n=1 Tax=Nocardioides sp. HDW12B TaxID=2714939 RepID=UPI00140E94BD|nr:hypothetical protein [Nocardioides sp. HDW12B]QIK65594.1 hypothetical protein G7072_03915 [Nocardioides sp. HDW12B]
MTDDPDRDLPGHEGAAEALLPLFALFDDLEQQAEGLELERRDAEVADRLRDEYAEIDLAARLHASVGAVVELTVPGPGASGASTGGERVRGTLVRVGAGWLLLAVDGRELLVRADALVVARGLSEEALPVGARSVLSRLTLTSCLRRLAEEGERQVLRLVDGSRCAGELGRVGADFVELWDDRGVVQVPLAALVWVHRA